MYIQNIAIGTILRLIRSGMERDVRRPERMSVEIY